MPDVPARLGGKSGGGDSSPPFLTAPAQARAAAGFQKPTEETFTIGFPLW